MKHTLAKMIACLALTGSAVAMAESAATQGAAVQPSTHSSATALGNMDVDKIEGKDILDSSGAQLGDVDEVVVNNANQPMAVIGLEDSDKEVAVPLNKLALSSDGKNIVTRLSRADLLALPDYDPMDMKSIDD